MLESLGDFSGWKTRIYEQILFGKKINPETKKWISPYNYQF